MPNLVVVNKLKDLEANLPGIQIITAKNYLTDPSYFEMKGARVFNLCRSYSYQSTGYYISLLAQARGHKIVPSITTIQDTKTVSIIRLRSEEMEDLIQKSLGDVKKDELVLDVCFGKSLQPEFQTLGRAIFYQFEMPLLRAFFEKKNTKWRLQDVDPISLKELTDGEKVLAIEAAESYFSMKQSPGAKKQPEYRYDLAILVNPEEPQPPSNKTAVKKFIKAAEELGIGAWTITKEEYTHLGEYDALFIRETTNVNHYTYRFARRAAVEGLVVIDDPESIMKCSNKVYLAELMERQQIPTPKTMIVQKDNAEEVEHQFSFPLILKMPDSAFSQGVVKVNSSEELQIELQKFLSKSDLIIAQEYLPTEFDWRVGILDKKPLFVCKYYMAGDHWQIVDYSAKGEDRFGRHETFSVSKAPSNVVDIALKAANLIGDGFYGVDLKEIDGKVYLVEINDNPSIDSDVEDEILGDELYNRIMDVFLKRMEIRTAVKK